jgi:hypothetical protein
MKKAFTAAVVGVVIIWAISLKGGDLDINISADKFNLSIQTQMES